MAEDRATGSPSRTLRFAVITWPQSTRLKIVLGAAGYEFYNLVFSARSGLMDYTTNPAENLRHRSVTEDLRRTKRTSVEKVLIILIQSGMIYCVMQAVYPLLIIVFISDDHPIVESFGFSAVDNGNTKAGASGNQRPATGNATHSRLVFAIQRTTTNYASHHDSVQGFVNSTEVGAQMIPYTNLLKNGSQADGIEVKAGIVPPAIV
ncbi:hypothetical protein H0H92_009384 [Tricholoma furcatifolium]|nr:hypothetical protein H0H92_009384 [Tricholoma furcatifolium]